MKKEFKILRIDEAHHDNRIRRADAISTNGKTSGRIHRIPTEVKVGSIVVAYEIPNATHNGGTSLYDFVEIIKI